jgi:hypothetical protein
MPLRTETKVHIHERSYMTRAKPFFTNRNKVHIHERSYMTRPNHSKPWLKHPSRGQTIIAKAVKQTNACSHNCLLQTLRPSQDPSLQSIPPTMKLFKTMLFFVVALCMAAMTSAAAEAKDAAVQVGGGAGLRGAVVDGSVHHRGLQLNWTTCRMICLPYAKWHCPYCKGYYP